MKRIYLTTISKMRILTTEFIFKNENWSKCELKGLQDMEFSANFSTLLHKRGDLAATSRNTFESKDLFGWNFYKTKRGKGIFPFDRRHRVRQIFIVDCQLPHSERKILFNIFPGRDDIA